MMEENKPCLVCGDSKATYHYGSHCCSGCKGFFRRSIKAKRKYTCQNDDKCNVVVEQRNACRACRFRKCLEVKMNPTMVHGDHGKIHKLFDAKFLNNPSSTSTDLFNNDETNDEIPNLSVVKTEKNKPFENRYKKWNQFALNIKFDSISNTCPLSTMKIIPIFDPNDANSVSQYFVLVEKLCDNFVDSQSNHMFSSEKDYQCFASVSMETAYHNPRNVSVRTPIEWKGRYYIDSTKLKPMWCRIFTHFIDWLSHIPELSLLSANDRLKLMIDRASPSVNILCAYRAVVTNTKGMVLSGGSYFPRDETQQKQLDKKVSLKQANWIYDEFISPARHMHLTENEYAILRVLLYLMPADNMSEVGKKIVRDAANFYRNVLCTQIRESYPNLSFQQVMDRMSRMMAFLTVMENAKAMTNAGISMMVLFNCPEMKQDLIYEIHVRGSEAA